MGGVAQGSSKTKQGGQTDQSTTEQAKEKVQETADQVQEKAGELKGQAGSKLRTEIDSRTTQAGSQLYSTADAMRRTGDKLREEGNDAPAKIIDGIAQRAERLGNYMTGVDGDKMLRDVEDFGRRQPWLLAVSGAALGFFASRFLKASSSQRYESSSSYRYGSYGSLPQGSTGYGGAGMSSTDLDAPSMREYEAGAALGATGPSAAASRGGSRGSAQ